MSKTPHLDHLRRFGRLPKFRFTRRTVLFFPGTVADGIGALALQEIADEKGEILAITESSKYHAGKLFRPKKAKKK